MKTVLIIHYNTPELTRAAILSLRKTTPGCQVVLFDNSNQRPFCADDCDNVTVIDNTQRQIIDFDRWIGQNFPNRKPSPGNNYGSAKHCKSVDICFDLIPDGFVLMDSDVLVKQDFSSFFDTRCAWVGQTHCNTRRFGVEIQRIKPFLCWVNVPMLRENGIRYFNPKKMWDLTMREPHNHYDTGAWLLEACTQKALPFRHLDIGDYIIHLRHGSWRDKDAKAWLEENKTLWL